MLELTASAARKEEKSIRFNKQNNNFAPAAHFFVHFFAVVVATLNFQDTRFMD